MEVHNVERRLGDVALIREIAYLGDHSGCTRSSRPLPILKPGFASARHPSRPFRLAAGKRIVPPASQQPEGQNLRSKSAASGDGCGEKSSARTMSTALRRCMQPGLKWKQRVWRRRPNGASLYIG